MPENDNTPILKLEPWVTLAEIRKYIPMSPSMIRNECNKLKNPMPHRRMGSSYLFLVSRVSAWMDSEAVFPASLS